MYDTHDTTPYLWSSQGRHQRRTDSSSDPVDTGPPKSGSWSFNDNVKVLIILLTLFYVIFAMYLFYSTYRKLLTYETRLDALVGQEQLKEVKERQRLEKESARRTELLLRVTGQAPERQRPSEPPQHLDRLHMDKMLADFFDESSKTVEELNNPKYKTKRKKSKGWKSIAMLSDGRWHTVRD